jgi:hypothetical protein
MSIIRVSRGSLAHVVHGGELAGFPHEAELVPVFLGRQRFFELVGPVEVVFDGALAPARDQQNVVEACCDGLFHDILNRRLVDDRQHLLGRRLGRGQEPCSQSCGGDHGLGYC